MPWLSTIPHRASDRSPDRRTAEPRLVLLEAPGGEKRRRWLESWLAAETREPGTAGFHLDCRAGFAGPWAGVKDLMRALVPRLAASAPELIDRHNTELLLVLPTLKKSWAPKHPTLTDIAFAEEKVRNYPMDRAYRNVHGLIDLIAAWQRKAGHHRWILVCDGYDQASALGGTFFRELLRRCGEQLGLTVVLAGENGAFSAPGAIESLPGAAETIRVRPELAAEGLTPDAEAEGPDAEAEGPARFKALAERLEREFADDDLERAELLPELIHHLLAAGEADRALVWQAWAFAEYNHAGFYEDALRYGEVAVRNIDAICSRTVFTRWNLVGGLCNCYIAMLQPENALRIVEQEALDKVEDPADRARIDYVIAMIHARFLPKIDLAAAERYLERGLATLDLPEVGQRDRCFLKVFILNGLAFVRHRQGKPQEALDLCQDGFATLGKEFSATKHRLHRSVLLYNTGQVYVALRQPRQAIEYYSEAIEMDPNYSEYRNERGNLHLELGELEAAIADYREAIAISPPYWEVWSNLGQAFKLQGRLQEAIEAYGRAIELDPGQLLPRLGRAQAHEAAGEPEAALADYSAALELDPRQPLALSNRAEIRYSLGQLALALEDLDRAIALDPGNAGLYFNRSVAHADGDDAEKAVADLRAYLTLAPDAADRAEVEQRIEHLAAAAA